MREYIKKIARGEIQQSRAELVLTPAAIEETRPCGRSVNGSIHLFCEDQPQMKGIVYSSDYRVELKTNQFSGAGAVLDYQIRDAYTGQEGQIKGRFHIVCMDGEYDLPYRFVFSQAQATGQSLDVPEQFASFAKGARDEALRIFDSDQFTELPFMQNLTLRSLYEGLRTQNDRQLGMEEFMVASGGKERVSLSVSEEEKICRMQQEDEMEDGILLTRSGWGYVRLSVKVTGDFIRPDKSVLTDSDFNGEELRLTYRILGEKLHPGKNLGCITLHSTLYHFRIPVTVCKGERDIIKANRRRGELAYRKLYLSEVGLKFQSQKEQLLTEGSYQKLRLAYGRLDTSSGSLTRLTLLQSIAASWHDPAESRRLLELVTDQVQVERLEEPGNYCLYLYAKKRLGDEEEERTTLRAIVQKYDEDRPSDPAILILLLIADPEQGGHPAARWEKIRGYYERGSRSPWLYLAALLTLKEDERLLQKPDELTLATLYFGMRRGMIPKKLADAAADLTAKNRRASVRELDLLITLYERYRTETLLTGLLSLLIKMDRRLPADFLYYEEGVKQDLKLTRLYDYYLYTLPPDDKALLPKPLLLYFSYQPPLDYEAKTRLYRNILTHREQIPDIFQTYEKEMEQFALDQMLKGRMSRELAEIYRQLIYPEMLDERAGKVFPALLCARAFQCDNPDITHVLLCYEDRKAEERFGIYGQNACIPVYSRHVHLIFQDGYGNRYGSLPYRLEPLMEDCPALLEACFQVEKTQPEYFHTRLWEIYESGQVTQEEIGLVERGLAEENLQELFRRKLAVIGIRYYLSLPSQEKCDGFVAVADPAILDGESRKLLLELLVTKGYYEEAYRIVETYGYRDIRPGRLLKLCHDVIERYNAPDDYLIRLTHHLFMEDKLDNVILSYLCQYYNGSSERMYSILEAAQNSQVNLWDLPERLLAQLLFVRSGRWLDQVFPVYMKQGGVDSLLRDAYFTLKSWGYIRGDWDLPPDAAWYMEQKAWDPQEARKPGLLESLAMTRYYDGLETLSDRQKTLCRIYMEQFTEKGMIFAHFPRLALRAECLPWLKNRYFVEYQAEETDIVRIRGQILPAAAPPFQDKMVHVFRGIFIYEVTLFYGEQVEYEIYMDGTEKPVKTGVLATAQPARTEEGAILSRYQTINDMLMKAEAGNSGLTQAMLDYGKKTELLERLLHIR